eukprot:scaffold2936_cov113-Cylindrotheca_fusiformis.AAC.10
MLTVDPIDSIDIIGEMETVCGLRAPCALRKRSRLTHRALMFKQYGSYVFPVDQLLGLPLESIVGVCGTSTYLLVSYSRNRNEMLAIALI